MPKVVFTTNLNRHLDCPPQSVTGSTVREALDAAFAEVDGLESYVLDDQRQVRKHVNVFVDGQPVIDRVKLSDAVHDATEIYVMQALSGG